MNENGVGAQVPGVLLIKSYYRGRPFTQFVLQDDRTLLVDSGMAGWVRTRIVPKLAAAGIRLEDVAMVLNTHADVDHFGGNSELRAAVPGAILMAHRADAPLIEDWDCMVRERLGIYEHFGLGHSQETMVWLQEAAGPPTKLDLLLEGGEVLRLGPRREVEVVHLPGHSPGMVGVWDRSKRVLIATDAVLGRGMANKTGAIEGPPPYFEVSSYRRSLGRMLSLNFEWLLLSHHAPMNYQRGRAFLEESLAHTYAMETAILEFLAGREGTTSFREIYEAMLARFGPYSVMTNELCAPIRAHLDDLRRTNRVQLVQGQSKGALAWRVC